MKPSDCATRTSTPAERLVRVRARRNSNQARVKSGQREIPIAPALIRLYTDYLITECGDFDCDHVFVNLWAGNHGDPWRYWNVTDLIARLRTRSGIEFTAHMFRHTYATELLRREAPRRSCRSSSGTPRSPPPSAPMRTWTSPTFATLSSGPAGWPGPPAPPPRRKADDDDEPDPVGSDGRTRTRSLVRAGRAVDTRRLHRSPPHRPDRWWYRVRDRR